MHPIRLKFMPHSATVQGKLAVLPYCVMYNCCLLQRTNVSCVIFKYLHKMPKPGTMPKSINHSGIKK